MIDKNVSSLGWRLIRGSKRFWACLALLLVPLIGGILAYAQEGKAQGHVTAGFDAKPEFSLYYSEAWQALVLLSSLPLTAFLLAGGLVADEVEDRTLSYLLTRPVPRAKLYLSRLFPAALASGVFGAIQATLLGLTQVMAFFAYGMDTQQRLDSEEVGRMIDTGPAMLLMILGGIVAAFLLGVGLACLFAYLSVAVPKFHFVAALLVYLVVEVPFGLLGGLGPGILTLNYYALSFVGRLDRTQGGVGVGLEAPWLVALLALAGLTYFWTWMGMRRMARRDFNITSAAS